MSPAELGYTLSALAAGFAAGYGVRDWRYRRDIRRWRAENAEPVESLLSRLSEAHARRLDSLRQAAGAEFLYFRGLAEERAAFQTSVIYDLRARLIQRGVPRATVDAAGRIG